jgi:hypothetical protein
MNTNPRYDKPFNAVFNIALYQLSEDTRNPLYILAFLNPDEVPESMLLSGHKTVLRS